MLLTSRSAAFRLSRWKQRRKQKKMYMLLKKNKEKKLKLFVKGMDYFLPHELLACFPFAAKC
jgi:hypothetical protein